MFTLFYSATINIGLLFKNGNPNILFKNVTLKSFKQILSVKTEKITGAKIFVFHLIYFLSIL